MGIGISPDVSYKLYINGATYSNGDIISHSNFKTDRTGYGLRLIDSDSNEYVGIYDNGSNLWIGATSSTGQHHHGLTYISAGHNGTEGNKSIYISIPANGSNSTTHTSYPLVYKDATGTQYKGIYTDADGKTYAMTYELKATVNSGTATRMAYYSGDNAVSAVDHIEVLNNYLNSSSRNNKTVDVRINGLIIWGATYGNNTDSNNPTTCYPLLSNTPGVFRFGDGGPQIIFNTSATLGAQAGALIYTDNDAAATGASFHFVTTESSNNNGGNLTVTAPRFRARAGLTIGQNSDNTSYNLYVNGTSYFTGNMSFAAIGTTGTSPSISWSGSTDGASIYYTAASSDAGVLVVNMTDDANARISLRTQGTERIGIDSNGTYVNTQLQRAGKSVSWYQGRTTAIIKTTSYSGYDAILSMKTTAGDWSLGVYTDNICYLTYILDSNYSANTNTITKQFYFKPDGTIGGNSFTGNSATATALTSNAGGTEQPIYFTGGKPSATSYALKATVNNSTAGYFAYYSGARAVSGTSNARLTDGCLNLYPSSGSYREGLRIYPTGSWATIVLGGNDLSATSGTSANSWSIHNNNGNFYISRNASSAGRNLRCVDNVWSVGNKSNNASYAEAAFQIREEGYGGAGSDSWGRAPRLTWHWSGRVAAQIGLASNGYLYTAPLTGTTFYKLVYESGTWGISISGSAAKLTTARAINGTNFDGSAAITTANWGTARNITIKDASSTNAGTAVSVNGSAAVTLLLPSTIKASLTGNADTATRINGNLSAVTANRNCNVWVSDDGNPSGIPRYVSGFYINPSSKQLNAPGRVHAGSFEGTTAFLSNIELIWSDPYIDFHANSSSADYTVRFINAKNDGSVLTLFGSLVYTGQLVHSSSCIIKKDIKNITEEEAKRVFKLRPISYKYQEWFDRFDQPYPSFGFVAEEVLSIMPELVSIPNDYDEAKVRRKEQRPISLKEESLIPYLVKIVQMQQKQIDELKHQIKYLTN